MTQVMIIKDDKILVHSIAKALVRPCPSAPCEVT